MTSGESEPAPRPRPGTVDPDELGYLPTEPCIPVDGVAASGELQVALFEGKGLTVLPIYSSPELLHEACGDGQPYTQVPRDHLLEWQSQFGFHVVMVDRMLPPEFHHHEYDGPRDALPPATDPRTGEPAWLTPTRLPVTPEKAEIELRALDDRRVALLLYSSKAALLEAYEVGQPYMLLPDTQVETVCEQVGADCLLIDVISPYRQREGLDEKDRR